MKISKFVGSVLVALVAVGLVAPQQVEASSMVTWEGGATLTSSGDQHTFAPLIPGVINLTGPSTGLFSPLNDSLATADFMPFTWTGSGPSTALMGAPIIQEWTTSGGTSMFTYQFNLNSLTATSFEPDSFLDLTGEGTVFVFHNGQMSPPIPATISFFSNDVLPPSGEFFSFDSTTTVSTPDSGSALGLLGIGFVVVEGLRRKLATRQNRHA